MMKTLIPLFAAMLLLGSACDPVAPDTDQDCKQHADCPSQHGCNPTTSKCKPFDCDTEVMSEECKPRWNCLRLEGKKGICVCSRPSPDHAADYCEKPGR